MKVDLHIHSDFSDGKYTPAQVVGFAVQSGLGLIALTDHDTVDGVAEALATAQQSPKLRVIPGVEISTWQEQHELHILGYNIQPGHPGLLELLKIAQGNREKRILRTLDTLRANNIPLRMDDIRNGFRAVSLGRMHVAHALMNQGYVYSIREAFDRYLSYDTGVITLAQDDFVDARQAIEMILDAGGIPVLAHPNLEIFDRYLNTLTTYGLQGVEVFKSTKTSIEEFYFETVVHDKNLLLTGGSDWHGHHIPPKLGNFSVDSKRIQPFLKVVQVA